MKRKHKTKPVDKTSVGNDSAMTDTEAPKDQSWRGW